MGVIHKQILLVLLLFINLAETKAKVAFFRLYVIMHPPVSQLLTLSCFFEFHLKHFLEIIREKAIGEMDLLISDRNNS